MTKLVDYPCLHDKFVGFEEDVIRELNIPFPEGYCHGDTMARLALAQKEKTGAAFCTLPFCHTVEGEAFGGIVNLGNGTIGPRAKEYVVQSLDEVLALSDIDFSRGRIREVLDACRRLKEQGETVCLNISGPITVLNVLLDVKYVYKGLRKNPEVTYDVFWKIGRNLLQYVEEAKKLGVDMISYADSAGGVNILGPKLAREVVEHFTDPFIKELSGQLEGMLLILCPKTAYALTGCEKAEWRDVKLPEKMSYAEACAWGRDSIRITGHRCIKDSSGNYENDSIKELVLLS